jgi:hypothetical protein
MARGDVVVEFAADHKIANVRKFLIKHEILKNHNIERASQAHFDLLKELGPYLQQLHDDPYGVRSELHNG